VFAYVQVGGDKLADGLLGTGRLVCGELVDGGAAGGLLGRGDERRVRHAERLEDALPHFHVERTSRHLFRPVVVKGKQHLPGVLSLILQQLVPEHLLTDLQRLLYPRRRERGNLIFILFFFIKIRGCRGRRFFSAASLSLAQEIF
jgi:hypothetical protein